METSEIRLYVRTPQGRWQLVQSAPATQTSFDFKAPSDGEYWFSFATVSRKGQMSPANLDATPPHRAVMIDTVPPELTVQPVTIRGEKFLQCHVRDDNPDWSSLRVFFQSPDNSWKSLNLAAADSPNIFRVPHASVFESKIRVTAGDRAGNRTSREIDLGDPTVSLGFSNRPNLEKGKPDPAMFSRQDLSPITPSIPPAPPVDRDVRTVSNEEPVKSSVTNNEIPVLPEVPDIKTPDIKSVGSTGNESQKVSPIGNKSEANPLIEPPSLNLPEIKSSAPPSNSQSLIKAPAGTNELPPLPSANSIHAPDLKLNLPPLPEVPSIIAPETKNPISAPSQNSGKSESSDQNSKLEVKTPGQENLKLPDLKLPDVEIPKNLNDIKVPELPEAKSPSSDQTKTTKTEIQIPDLSSMRLPELPGSNASSEAKSTELPKDIRIPDLPNINSPGGSKQIEPSKEVKLPEIPTLDEKKSEIKNPIAIPDISTNRDRQPELPPMTSVSRKPVESIEPVKTDTMISKEAKTASHPILSSKTCTINYQTESTMRAGAKTDFWATSDNGRNWHQLRDESGGSTPAKLTLPGDGVFGIRIRPAGGTRPPENGEEPDCIVEIDSTKPEVNITQAVMGSGDNDGILTITWTAFDKNLVSNSINLLFATKPDGPWEKIVSGYKNDGLYRWAMPSGLTDRVYLKVEATDLAGNVGQHMLPAPIELQPSKQRVKVIGIGPSK